MLGEEHPDILGAAVHLALTYTKLGKFLKAVELQERVLAARKRVLGEAHKATLATAASLAATRRRQAEAGASAGGAGADLHGDAGRRSFGRAGRLHECGVLLLILVLNTTAELQSSANHQTAPRLPRYTPLQRRLAS